MPLKRLVKRLLLVLRLNIAVLLIVSLLANIALGVLNFVIQPIWRAAAVTTAVAAHEVQSELEERRAVAKAKAKEKAKARLKRIATAVPLAGLGAAGYFEFRDYKEWLTDHPDGDFTIYSQQVISDTQEVVDEVLAELPEIPGLNRDVILGLLQAVLQSAERLAD